jgi:hypothetical protein
MIQTNPQAIARFDAYVGISPVAVAIAVLTVCRALASPPIGIPKLFEGLDADKNGELTAAEILPDQQRLFTRLLRRGDTNNDQALSREEFDLAMVPDRPEKPLEAKQPTTFPQADAVRWLLLTMDANGNARIERTEVVDRLGRVFDAMADRIDANENGILEPIELTRGGPPIARIAGRYTQQNGIDVARELKQLEERQGAAASRFEARPVQFEDLADPVKARQVFLQLDTNQNARVETNEVPEPLQRRIQRLMRLADRDGDGQLSEREFLAGVRRLAARMAQQQTDEMPARETVPGGSPLPDSR